MSDLEAALRAALGTQDPEEEDFQPGEEDAPLALNDDGGLRNIIMQQIQGHAEQTALQKQSAEAGQQMIHALKNHGATN